MAIARPASGWRWQDAAKGGGLMDEAHPVRRSGVGWTDVRFEGLSDLLLHARGASVIDIGCNRGHVLYEFYTNGARLVHGCDIYGPGIMAAQHWFAELSEIDSKFAVVDLTDPAALTAAFGPEGYDIVLFLGVFHKLKRNMDPANLILLGKHLGARALKFFAWSGYAADLSLMDEILQPNLKRVHTSEMARAGMPAAIWKRM